MAWSAHSDPDAVKEFECNQEELKAQAKELAEWIQCSKHLVVFTGAGVSTSSGIPDFRGPKGVWTLRAQGLQAKSKTSAVKAMPTVTHMGLVALEQAGLLKFLISQNTDGLHRKGGIPRTKLAELHGNTNLEYCPKCSKEYMRDFRCARAGNHVHDHSTGRLCSCGTELLDSIINFKEALPDKALQDGFAHSEKADLFIVLGSSLTVTPAADMPKIAAKNGAKLVICNLQKTPLDSQASLRIFAKTDNLVHCVLHEYLKMEIPSWVLQRGVTVCQRKIPGRGGVLKLTIEGVESDGTAASLFSAVKVVDANRQYAKVCEKEPFVFEMTHLDDVVIYLEFMGHYNEPILELKLLNFLPAIKDQGKIYLKLMYNPATSQWNVYPAQF